MRTAQTPGIQIPATPVIWAIPEAQEIPEAAELQEMPEIQELPVQEVPAVIPEAIAANQNQKQQIMMGYNP